MGGQLGVRYGRWGADFTGLIRLFHAPSPYAVRRDNEIVDTRQFFGGYIGLDPVFELLSAGRFNTEVFAGFGYDGIEAIGGEDDEYVGLNSFNINLGITQRIFVDKAHSKFIGVQFRHHFVDYYTHGGSDLTGHQLSINLVAGYMGNTYANQQLRNLSYFRD